MFDNVIVIPYRNRERHLKYYLENTVPLLKQYLPNSKVVIIEQGQEGLFAEIMIFTTFFYRKTMMTGELPTISQYAPTSIHNSYTCTNLIITYIHLINIMN